MPNPLTYERALEEAQDCCYYGDPHGIDCRICRKIATALIISAINEASEEVCVNCECDHRHAHIGPTVRYAGMCIAHQCIKFLSRRHFLELEREKLKGQPT